MAFGIAVRMRGKRRLAALLLGGLLAPRARAQTISPSDFDPSLRVRDERILSRVRDGFSAMGELPPPATFELPNGAFTVEQRWTADPITGEDVLRGRASFVPGSACPVCREVRFVQIARVEAKLGQDIDWTEGQKNRNSMRTRGDAARSTVAGYFVDHDASKCSAGAPCSPYFRDSWPNPDESADGANLPAERRPASLVDYPFGWTLFERISLEACARCVDTGEYLGCVEWGATWPTTGDRSLRIPGAAPKPSPTFSAARALFDRFYPARHPGGL